MRLGGWLTAIFALVFTIGGIIWAYNALEQVDADEIVVIQSLIEGKLDWYTTPGIKWQNWGRVTRYQKLSAFDFDTKVMFNDNGNGMMRGKLQVELPLDVERLTLLHTKYGSQEAIEQSLIKPSVEKAIYFAGPLMSSKESSVDRKSDLIRYVVDQIEHGVYQTAQETVTLEDPVTREKRTAVTAKIILDKDNQIARQEESALTEFGIRITNFAPREIEYDEVVKNQIKKQQDIIMQVQTSRATALEAEQRRVTAQAEGEAKVMTARYEKEVEKIQAVTEAMRDYEVAQTNAKRELDVATLNARTQEQNKRANILLGEGEAAYKRLVMQADGALTQKINAYKHVNELWANAVANYGGQWVPSIVMGGDGKGTHNNAQAMIDLLTTKTARDLALDMGIPKTVRQQPQPQQEGQ